LKYSLRIACEFAYYGHNVRIYDAKSSAFDKVYERLNEDLTGLYLNGLISSPSLEGQISFTNAIVDAVRDANLIIECIVEDIIVKNSVFSTISRLALPSAIITTNTLNLDIKTMADFVVGKERFFGLRFLYPVYCISDVEITPTSFTSTVVIEKTRLILSEMDKTLFHRRGKSVHQLTPKEIEQQYAKRKEKLKLDLYVRNPTPNDTSTDQQASTLNLSDPEKTSSHLTCAICLENPRNSILTPCNHLVSCYDCSIKLQTSNRTCPICRQQITQAIKIYIP
jgi:3-hydroxyacyl-CoA dehydrogenase